MPAPRRAAGFSKPVIFAAYARRMELLEPLALSMAAAVLGVLLGTVRVWRMLRRFAPRHPNARTARRFALGFTLAAVLWLAYGMLTGYARFLQPGELPWLLAVHRDALWSIPLFITAIVWAAGIGIGWVMRLLQREGDTLPPTP